MKFEAAKDRRFCAACLASAVAGCGTSFQSGVNVSLATTVAGGRFCAALFAGFLSFSGGLALLVSINALDSTLVADTPWNCRELRARDVVGGALGSSVMTLGLLANKRIGFGLTAVNRMGGSLAVSLLLDHRGACGYKKRPCTLRSARICLLGARRGETENFIPGRVSVVAGSTETRPQRRDTRSPARSRTPHTHTTLGSRNRLRRTAALLAVFAGASAAALSGGPTEAEASAATFFFCLLAALAGTLLPLQASVNRACAEKLGRKLRGTLVRRCAVFPRRA